jgi:hypothetical protein
MAPEVVAALIAAGIATVLASVDLVDRYGVERRKQEQQMFLTALEHMQGSQRRSIGIAALTILRDRDRTWRKYRSTIRELFYRQLLYLYVHGENRWQAHEVANIEAMTAWLFDNKLLGPMSVEMRTQLAKVMKVYAQQQFDNLPKEVRNKGSQESVQHLQDRIKKWVHIRDPRSSPGGQDAPSATRPPVPG